VTATGLGQSLAAYQRLVETIEGDGWPRCRVLGEPQLGRRGLYPSLSMKGSTGGVRPMLDLLSEADGTRSLLEIADRMGRPVWELAPWVEPLRAHGLLSVEEVHR